MVATTTRLHVDYTARFNSIKQHLQPIGTSKLLALDGLLIAIETLYLEHILSNRH